MKDFSLILWYGLCKRGLFIFRKVLVRGTLIYRDLFEIVILYII